LSARTCAISAADQHADRLAGIAFERGFQRLLHRGFGFAGGEDHIAAGDVGFDAGKAQRLAHRLQLGHRQLAGAADIHRTKQGNEGGHCESIR
jgi:hypothetical protein